MTTETDVLAVLNGYSLDIILPCIADHEKTRVMVKTGAGLMGAVFQ